MDAEVAPGASTRRLSLATGDAVRALVSTHGHGVKCLLLHGNPGSLEDWAELLPSLRELADFAAIDLPGFGQSPKGRGALTLTRLSDVALAVADALGWHEPFFVVGHSHGGGVAQMLAARHPERVAGLGLLATLGHPAHGSYRLLALPGATSVARLFGWLLRAKPARPLAAGVLRAVLRDIYWPERVPAARVDSELAALSERPEILLSMVGVALGDPCQQLSTCAPAIRCPVLFVHGQHDRLVPERHAETLHRRISEAGGKSRWRAIGGAGHLLPTFQARELMEELRELFHEPAAH